LKKGIGIFSSHSFPRGGACKKHEGLNAQIWDLFNSIFHSPVTKPKKGSASTYFAYDFGYLKLEGDWFLVVKKGKEDLMHLLGESLYSIDEKTRSTE